MAFAYDVCGIVLQSEVTLPALASRAHGSADAPATAIAFRLGGLPPAPSDWLLVRPVRGGDEPWMSVGRAADGYFLRVHDEADFWIDGAGAEIRCAPGPGCDDASTEQLLLDQILPQALHARGQPSFHASAVADAAGQVTAFLGPSGSGKSTTAARLAGASGLVSDDCLVVALEPDRVCVHPSYPSVRLLDDSVVGMGLSGASLPLVAPRTDKLRLTLPRAAGALSLRRLLILAEGPVGLRPFGRRDAVVHLAEHLHRLDPGDRRRLVEELDFLEALVARVPVFTLSFPRRYGALDEVSALLA